MIFMLTIIVINIDGQHVTSIKDVDRDWVGDFVKLSLIKVLKNQT